MVSELGSSSKTSRDSGGRISAYLFSSLVVRVYLSARLDHLDSINTNFSDFPDLPSVSFSKLNSVINICWVNLLHLLFGFYLIVYYI